MPNYFGDQIKKNEAVGTGQEKAGFLWENLGKTSHLEDLSTDGRIILKGFLKK
jgi:hypothetical protein